MLRFFVLNWFVPLRTRCNTFWTTKATNCVEQNKSYRYVFVFVSQQRKARLPPFFRVDLTPSSKKQLKSEERRCKLQTALQAIYFVETRTPTQICAWTTDLKKKEFKAVWDVRLRQLPVAYYQSFFASHETLTQTTHPSANSLVSKLTHVEKRNFFEMQHKVAACQAVDSLQLKLLICLPFCC